MDVGALIGPLATVLGIGITGAVSVWTTVLLRRSQREQRQAEHRVIAQQREADVLRARAEELERKQGRLDTRSEQLLDALTEENERLRGLLSQREGRQG